MRPLIEGPENPLRAFDPSSYGSQELDPRINVDSLGGESASGSGGFDY
jgi:hypothetical protein